MHPSTVTFKGQVTIPAELRKDLGILEGDKVAFERKGHQILITPIKKVDLTALFGSLPKPEKILSLEEIKAIIEEQS